ncbi:MAG: acetamidase/formamidase family protein, partial [Xenophilus sp.]
MRFKQFTTESYPVHQRLDVWREALSAHRLRPVLAAGSAPLYGTLTGGSTGRGVGLARIASSPQTLAHLRHDADAVWLSLHQAGEASWRHKGSETLGLVPGDIVYGPAGAEASAVFHTDFRQFRVVLPGSVLKARLPHASHGGGVAPGHLSGRSGMGRLLAGTLGALAEALETLGDDEIAPVEFSLLEFVAGTLAAQRDEAGAFGNTQAATLRRICQWIEGALSDPELSLAAVAAHERISERLVQKLFEGVDMSFTTYVRQRRLERCRADLANRQYGHLSISDICFRWGFNDAAHFSHAFRDRYQMSPRQFRQQANEASQKTLRSRIQRGWPSGYFETPAAAAEGQGPREATLAQAGPAACAAPGATSAAGRHHHLPATAQTIHWGYFSRAIPPALTIASGDIVTIETLTQHAYDDHERMIKGDSGAESVFHWTREHKAVDRRGAGPADASIFGRGSGEGFGVHILTGPVAVEGAQPGDVLEIRILDLAPRLAANAKYEGRAFGSNAAAWWGFHYDDLLEEPRPREVVTIYEVDCNPGQMCAHAVYNFRWTPQTDPRGVLHPTIDYPGVPVDRTSIVENHGVLQGVKIPVRPHFGVIGLAPAETGLVDSVPPSYFGGNIDNWRVAKGATVYLRVAVDGGLLSVGDPHASQGDSELCGTAIECSLTGVFQIVLHKAGALRNEAYADIDYPLVETADEWVLHGFSHPNYMKDLGEKARSLIYEKSSLDPAMRDAFRKTRRFLMTAMGLTEDEAISLMSVAVDFGVTQVVDGNWGVHAVIRKS